ncbi:50S ribosomal protein L18a [bacterium]|nr:50S ribosomal protein L18a [bacterium]|tara:strand:+ start:37719 stop:38027 length:309 start_codon:yes stop_codon:yes gene_type:complete
MNIYRNLNIIVSAVFVAFISKSKFGRNMQAYRIDGSFRQGKTNQKFCIDLVAENEDQVREKVYSNFGSRHGVKRRYITIVSINTIDPSESSAPVVVSHFRDK